MGDRTPMFARQNRLEIRLLGTFHVTVDGRPAGTGGSKRDALLALLALRRGRPASVEALIDDLWGTDLPASPRNAVQHHVARLRAALGHDAIVGTPNGYAVTDATTDALVFEELLVEARSALRDGDARTAADVAARALSLWGGSALEGLADTDSVRAELLLSTLLARPTDITWDIRGRTIIAPTTIRTSTRINTEPSSAVLSRAACDLVISSASPSGCKTRPRWRRPPRSHRATGSQ